MYIIKKRLRYFERWEFENQKLLAKLSLNFVKVFSLLAYLAFKSLKLIVLFFRVFFVEQREVSQFHEQEKLKRIQLSEYQSFLRK